MKIIVFGAAGQVGTDCVTALSSAGYSVIALTRQDVDFSRPDLLAKKINDIQPELVVNACAYTAVDKAEEEKELADLVNHLSVKEMAQACSKLAIPLIHISTDYVFDGSASMPYSEEDPVSALGVYGETKLAGENAIRSIMENYIILRTSWVFGEHGNNFVKTMLRVGAVRDELKVVDDQVGRPTYVGDIVSTILFFVNRYKAEKILPWGIYHCSSEGEISWHGFAKTIFTLAKEQGLIEREPKVLAIPSIEYPTPAPRPAYSVLATNKLNNLMGVPLPHWREGLLHFLKHQLSQKQS